MDVLDLVREAVENSVEAGAANITVQVIEKDGMCRVTVTDDGSAVIRGDLFAEDHSGKGPGRGHGLALIKEASSGHCRIDRNDGLTVLVFSACGTVVSEDLSSSLLPLFLFPAEVSLTIDRDGRSMMLRTGELRSAGAFPDRAGAIGRFRMMVRQKEGEIYG